MSSDSVARLRWCLFSGCLVHDGNQGTQYLILRARRLGAGFALPHEAAEECFDAVDECIAAEGASGACVPAKAQELRLFNIECQVLAPVADVSDHFVHIADKRVGCPREVSARAAPRPIGGRCGESRSNRIQLDVAHGRQEIVFVHDERTEAPLPQIAAPSLALVDEARVAPVRFADGPGQPFLRLGARDQVDVVGHEAIGQNRNLVAFAPGLHQIGVDGIIALLQEGGHAPVAALRDVMRHTRAYNSRYACHAQSIAETRPKNQIKYCVPVILASSKQVRSGALKARPDLVLGRAKRRPGLQALKSIEPRKGGSRGKYQFLESEVKQSPLDR